ncbi:MAG: hypothetical protein AB7G75_25095 [Candidatus Binatia bacterium]
MTFFRRFASFGLIVGGGVALFYLYTVWNTFPPPSGRTPIGRLLGALGVLTVLSSTFSYRWRRQVVAREQQDRWHIQLGLWSVGLLLLHSHFHFGNGVAVLAFVSLLAVVLSGVAIILCDQRLTDLDAESGNSEATRTTHLRYTSLREQWSTLHVAATAGFLTFAVIHILSVFYY